MRRPSRAPVWPRFLAFGPLVVLIPLAGCNELLEPHPPAGVAVERGSGQIATVGTELADSLVVRVVDAIGRPVADVPVRWRDVQGLGTLSAEHVRTDQRGRSAVAWTLGLEAGLQRVQAEVEGLGEATFWATGRAGPLASVRIAPDSVNVRAVGDTVHLRVLGADAHGNGVGAVAVTWSSLDDSVASVDEDGVVLGLAEGTARIIATRDAIADTAVFAVYDDPNGPRIASLSADTLRPGATVVITGENFADRADGNIVTVDGLAVEVVSASPTRLEVKLPPRSAFRCEPTREAGVIVRAGPNRATVARPLVAAARRALAPGEVAMILDPAEVRCNELVDPDGDYLISLFNVSESPAAFATVRLRGTRSDPMVLVADDMAERGATGSTIRAVGTRHGPIGALPVTRPGAALGATHVVGQGTPFTGAPARPASPVPGEEVGLRSAERHRMILEANRRFVEASPGAAGVRRRPGESSALRARPEMDLVGDTALLRVPGVNRFDPCREHREIRARVVYMGEYTVIYEDVDAPHAGRMDSIYHVLGVEYDEVMHPLLRRYFGDPLAFDDRLRGAGRVAMLFTPQVNDLGGVVGFVWAGDFYDRELCAASNERGILYGVVPTAPVGDAGRDSPGGWHRRVRAVVMHEAKHVASMAERFSRNGGNALEAVWLEEASAMLASELYGREVNGYTRYGETDYRSSLYCELRPEDPGCAGRPVVMLDAFAWLFDYLYSMPVRTPLGSAVQGDASFYGSGWALLRWAIDHHGHDESAFLSALTQEPRLRGLANLLARAGIGREELIGGWTLSLGLAGATGAVKGGRSAPSWDLLDIFAGLHQELPHYFVEADPRRIQRLEMGDFAADVQLLIGGSGALFEVAGRPGGGQILEVTHTSGAMASNIVRVAIARLR